jgi:hypothetical protein
MIFFFTWIQEEENLPPEMIQDPPTSGVTAVEG